MSRLIDQAPRAFSKYAKKDDSTNLRIAKSIIEVLGDDLTSVASLDDMSRLDIISEAGQARNLDRIRIKDSIYENQVHNDLWDDSDLFL